MHTERVWGAAASAHGLRLSAKYSPEGCGGIKPQPSLIPALFSLWSLLLTELMCVEAEQIPRLATSFGNRKVATMSSTMLLPPAGEYRGSRAAGPQGLQASGGFKSSRCLAGSEWHHAQRGAMLVPPPQPARESSQAPLRAITAT